MFVECRVIYLYPREYEYDNQRSKWGVFVDDICVVTTDSKELSEEFKKRVIKYINNEEITPFESEYLNFIMNKMFRTMGKHHNGFIRSFD